MMLPFRGREGRRHLHFGMPETLGGARYRMAPEAQLGLEEFGEEDEGLTKKRRVDGKLDPEW